jgi:hypothetical protein
MFQTLFHPLAAGTKVTLERRNALCRETITACEGQMGTSRTWWYQTDAGKRASEYQIVNVRTK